MDIVWHFYIKEFLIYVMQIQLSIKMDEAPPSGEFTEALDLKESSLDKGKENSQQGPLSRSVCKLQFTEKGKQLRDETAKKQLKAFLKSCHSWKETARDRKWTPVPHTQQKYAIL